MRSRAKMSSPASRAGCETSCSPRALLVPAGSRIVLLEVRLVVSGLPVPAADQVQQLHLPELDGMALGLERDRAARGHLPVPLDRGIVVEEVAEAPAEGRVLVL